ncbi:MAG: ABC transporter ATP-binding protein [Acidimicrobiia bacterium]|nr:ABC transporter ATP-binding protein [Acidimicrobiia bacterium]
MGAAGMPAEPVKDLRGATRRLLATMGPERWVALVVVVATIASVALAVTGPLLLGRATDVVVDGALGTDGVDFDRLRAILLLALGVYGASVSLSLLQGWLLAGVVQRTMRRLRSAVQEKIHRLSLPYVDQTPRGELLSRVTNDIDNVAQSLQQSLSQLLQSTLTIVGVLVMMFVISPPLALIGLFTVPASIFIVRTVIGRAKGRFIAQWTHTGALNAQVEEAIGGHSLVQVFGQSEAVRERFVAENEEVYQASYRAQFLAGTVQPMMMLLGNLNFVAIAVIGGLRVASGAMTIGDIQAFIQYSRQFTQPLTQVASMLNVLQSGLASAERVFELLDEPEEPPDPANAAPPGPPRGKVTFEEVSFRYHPDQPLIEDLSLVVEPGQTVAIVGPTGAGKTTLVNLILRFYDLDGGRITIDGVDTAEMTRHDVRAAVGMVLQDTWLFGGTIRENIRYGNLDADDAAVEEAARAAYVDRFVHALPDGYDTVVSDEGAALSTGEKQLVTIARAFLSNPTILILDEATSSVDTRTEMLIGEATAALRASRTSFVIAHRLSTIRDADRILVMDAGRIVEQGDHATLLAADGAYAALYASQFAGPVTN